MTIDWLPSMQDILTLLVIGVSFVAGWVRLNSNQNKSIEDIKLIKGEVFHETRGNQALYARTLGQHDLNNANYLHIQEDLADMKTAIREMRQGLDSGLREIRDMVDRHIRKE